MDKLIKKIIAILSIAMIINCSSDDNNNVNTTNESLEYSNNLLGRTFTNFDANGSIFEKNESKFENGKLTVMNQYFYNDYSDINDETISFTYNTDNNLTGGIIEYTDSNNKRKFDITYDSSNKMTSYITSYDYDALTQRYNRFEKSSYLWIDNTTCETTMEYQDEYNPLTFKEKSYYTSSGQLFKIERSDFIGDSSSANYIPKKIDIVYNSTNNIESFTIDNDFYEVKNATFKENQFSNLYQSLTAYNIYTPIVDNDQDIIFDISLNDFENAEIYKNGDLYFHIISKVDNNNRIIKRESIFENGYKKVEEFLFKN